MVSVTSLRWQIKKRNEMNDPERVAFRSPGQRPEEKRNGEKIEAGESEGGRKAIIARFGVNGLSWFLFL